MFSVTKFCSLNFIFFENFKILENDIINSHVILQTIVNFYKLAVISGKM
jgi:hypothetical protein